MRIPCATHLVILVDSGRKADWLLDAAYRRLLEELAKVDVAINEEKTSVVDLESGEHFTFLGFQFRRVRTLRGKRGIGFAPTAKARTRLLQKLREVFAEHQSQPVARVIEAINPILRGWANYFRIGQSARCFDYIESWVGMKVRRHLMRARQRAGVGWRRWSQDWLYANLGIYHDYQIRYHPSLTAWSARRVS